MEVPEFDQRFTEIRWLIVPYGLTIGLLYIWGYWSEFNLNVLQFGGVLDVIYSAIIPMALVFAFLAFSHVLYSAFFRLIRETIRSPGKEVKKRSIDPRLAIMLKLNVVFIASALLLSDLFWKWSILPLLIGLPLSAYIESSRWFKKRFAEIKVAGAVALLICMIPPLMFCSGKYKARQIVLGNEFDYRLPASSGDSRVEIAKSHRYLGHVGEYDFLYDPVTQSAHIVKTKDDAILVLKHFEPVRRSIYSSENNLLVEIWKKYGWGGLAWSE